MPVWLQCMGSVLEVAAQGFVALAVLGPILLDPHVQEEVDPAPELALELRPRPRADLLDPLAALAEHDRLLAWALHEDGLLDADAAVLALLPLVGLDGGGVGQLVAELQEDLLARHLRRQHALRQVRELILAIKPGPCP